MSDLVKDIPTQLLQILSADQAWHYMLVPYGLQEEKVLFYGDDAVTYDEIIVELQEIFSIKAVISPVPNLIVKELLIKYYRYKADNNTNAQAKGHKTDNNFLNRLINEAYCAKASDIHLETYESQCRVRFRLDGQLVEKYILEKDSYPSLVNRIKITAGLDIAEKRIPQDGRILYELDSGEKCDLRISTLPTIYGEKIVMRLLVRSMDLMDLSRLGFSKSQHEIYKEAIGKPYGIILICGPTGSGKSTTLYATLTELNSVTGNILTIEDPVEYTLAGVNQVQLKEDIGLTFSSALRSFLRQDPDIIMVGEIRDPETAGIAIRSALTGHLILSTIHTNTAIGAVSRLTDMGIDRYLLADTLLLCVAQRLVRLLCPDCKKKEEFSYPDRDIQISHHYTPVGCSKCYYTGYRGRKAIYEMVPVNKELNKAIREGTETDTGNQQLGRLSDSALSLLAEGLTSFAEILPMLNS